MRTSATVTTVVAARPATAGSGATASTQGGGHPRHPFCDVVGRRRSCMVAALGRDCIEALSARVAQAAGNDADVFGDQFVRLPLGGGRVSQVTVPEDRDDLVG